MYSQKTSKILVADSSAQTRRQLVLALKTAGFIVAEATTGKEALHLAKEFSPDLITLNVHLPDASGLEVCQKIKNDPATSHIAVLQISDGHTTAEEKIDGLDGGPDKFLTHPLEDTILVSSINALLRLRSVSSALRESEEMLRLAVQTTQIGTWDYSPGTHELRWSDQSKEIFGFDKKTAVTYELYVDRLHPEDRGDVLAQIEKVLKGEAHEIHIEHRLLYPDGRVRWVQGRGFMHNIGNSGDPQSLRIVGTVLDITERKMAMEELSIAKDNAENASRTKNQFIANVSHEIRTPLGAILGFTDIVLESNELSTENSHYISIIKRNALQLSKLIDEVLDLSKVEADKMIIEKTRMNTVEAVQDVMSVMKIKASEKGLGLDVIFDGRIPKFVNTDAHRLRQILINLLMNAIKFTERGKVELRISVKNPLALDRILDLQFDVIDSGIGITAEQESHLFQPFVQADSSMTRRYGGTGLGLTLSRKLTQMLGGTLELVDSKLAQGSHFRATINGGKYEGILAETSLGSHPAESAKVLPAIDKHYLQDKRVLVVEDAKDNQLILKRILSLSGAYVDIANNGEEGIEKALNAVYDIVLMDIQMPLVNGYEAVHQLREKQYSVPIIALTAHALRGERERCIESGFTDYMTKPIDRKLLLDKIHQLIL